MSNSAVTSVYRFVIDDVITNVRRDFEDMGVDETIMHELQRSWETKIAQSKVAAFQAPEPVAPAETYPAFEEPTYDHAPPPTTAASTFATPAAVQTFSYRAEQTPAANLANVASTSAPHIAGDNSVGRPQAHIPPRSTVASSTSSISNSANTNNISLPGGGRNTNGHSNHIPQTDGAHDTTVMQLMSTAELDAYVEQRFQEAKELQQQTGVAPGEMTFTLTLSDRAARKAKRDGLGMFNIGQVDGEDDEDDDTGLGSDLDDSDGDMDEESDNIVLCQYDKVSRTKSKWKCVLKDGIMLINGRDYLFHKANGDFEW